MPLYDWKCSVCGHIESNVIRPLNPPQPEPPMDCSACKGIGTMMRQFPTGTSFIVKKKK